MGKSKRKPMGYWNNPNNIINEAKTAMEEQGWVQLPGIHILKDKYKGLTSAIRKKYPNGYGGLRIDLGGTEIQKPSGYWKDPNNIIKEVRIAMGKNNWDTLPGSPEIKKSGYSTLCYAISHYYPDKFGGLRRDLGEGVLKRVDGYWKDSDNTIREARAIMKEQGWDKLPGESTLVDAGYKAIIYGISCFPGRIMGLRKKLGQKNPLRRRGYWKDSDNTIREARAIMKEQGWDKLPNGKKLRKEGYGALDSGIKSYSGGYAQLRKDIDGGASERDQIESLLEKYVKERI